MFDNVLLIFALIGAFYLGITATVLAGFTVIKRMERQDQKNRDAMAEAVDLCETELDAEVLTLTS